MSWPNCTYRGVTYTFHHLVPFTFIAHGKRLRVGCGAHLFTRGPKPGDPPDLLFMDGKTPRTFEPARYAYSTHLPSALMTGAQGWVYSNAGRFVFKSAIPGIKSIYVIAFDMKASPSPKYDAKMQVVSAYLAPKLNLMPRAPFVDAVEALLSGAAVNWTKK